MTPVPYSIGLTHDERWQFACDLTARMTAQFPGEIIVGGVYGSTARGTDLATSDLDMLFVGRDGSAARSAHLLHRGTAISYRVVSQGELAHVLTTPTAEWPFLMGVLSTLHLLHGEQQAVNDWLNRGQMVPAERFRALLAAELPGLVVESYGRILSCAARGNIHDIGCAVVEVLFEMRQALCLLNQRWVTHDYYAGLLDTFDFAKLPTEYMQIVPALWAARDIPTITALARRLVAAYWQLLLDENIVVITNDTDELFAVLQGTIHDQPGF